MSRVASGPILTPKYQTPAGGSRQGLEDSFDRPDRRARSNYCWFLFAQTAQARKPEVCLVNTTNIERGEAVRRALLAVARACYVRDVPLPAVSLISRTIGICPEQTRRHIGRLIEDGVITVRRTRHRRFRIESIRP